MGDTPRSLAVLALASALGAVATHPHATGTAGSDIAVAACVGVALVGLGALAGPSAWIAACLLAAAGASGVWVAVATASAAAAVAATRAIPGSRRVVGGAIGLVVAQTLLRLPHGRLGLNAAISAAALGCLAVSAWPHVGPTARARLRGASITVARLAGLAVGGVVLSLLMARADVGVGIGRAQDGLDAARDGEGDAAASMLDDAHIAFRSAHRDLSAWWAKPALLLPVVGPHVRALVEVTDAGSGLAQAAATAARSAGIDDLRVTEGRLDLDRVEAINEPLAAIRTALRHTEDTVGRAGSPWLVPPVASRVLEFSDAVDEAVSDAATAADAVAVLPDILGADGRRQYFVAFGTPAETRELGGFMGAYAILTADDGKIRLESTGRVRDLNQASRGRSLADPSDFPPYYLSFEPERFWQNVTASADFPTVAEAVRQMWPSVDRGDLDGVLYMDPETLADLLDLTGPILVDGYDTPLTADNAADFLLREQYIAFPDDDRHDFLVDAATTVFDELTSGDLPPPAMIADALTPSVREGRLLVNGFRPAEQAVFAQLRIDGELPAVRGDFLSVRASNRGQSKIDAMMRRTIAYDVVLDPAQGIVRSTVTVTIANDAPASGLPGAVIGNQLGRPAGTNSTTVALYTPLELVELTQDGRPVGRGATTEHGRFRYIALVDVPPGRSVTVVFDLEGRVDLRDGYHLDVLPQPMVNADQLHVTITGRDGWFVRGDEELTTELRRRQQVDAEFFTLR